MSEKRAPAMRLTDFDVIGCKIISPLHLATLLAYAQQSCSQQPIRVMAITSKGLWGKAILKELQPPEASITVHYIPETDFSEEASKLWPIFLLLKPLWLFIAQKMKRNLVPVCAPTMTSLRFSAANWERFSATRPVVLDEGIGSFNARNLFQKQARIQFSNLLISETFWRLSYFLWNHLSWMGVQRVSLFEFDCDKPKINREVAASYRKVFRMNYEQRDKPLAIPENAALILTQPFSEMGIYSESELFEAVRAVASAVRANGLTPVIKAHPAEARGKYRHLGVECLEYDGAVEEVFAGQEGRIMQVWGFNSTSLITGKVLFGLETISVSMPRESEYLSMPDSQASTLYDMYTRHINLKETMTQLDDR